MTVSAANARARQIGGPLALVVALVFAVVALLPAAAGAADNAGTVTFSDGSGGSQAVFSVRPPEGARCPGDTAHDFFLVNSYLVRKGTSPTAVTFKGGVPSLGYGLIDEGAFFGGINTERNTGALFLFPDHSTWSRLTTKDVFPKGEASTVWETGLACADRDGVVQRYWNTEVTFTAAAQDPGGFTWRVAKGASPESATSPVWILAAIALGAVAIVAVVVFVRSRRRASRPVGQRL